MALHPSGLFLLVGFSEKLRLMNLLIDDIRSFKEFMIRGCREVSWELAMGGTVGLQVSKICLEMMAGRHCSTCTLHMYNYTNNTLPIRFSLQRFFVLLASIVGYHVHTCAVSSGVK